MGSTHPQVQVSLRYLGGVLEQEGKTDAAEAAYIEADGLAREAADRGDLRMKTFVAWRLATHPDARLRNGSNAVFYADQAVRASSRTNAGCLGALAAAYAESGRFTNAVQVQQEAIALVRDKQERDNMARRLTLYESGVPFRDSHLLGISIRLRLAGGRFAEAEALARQCVALGDQQDPDDWRTFHARAALGAALLGQKKYGEETERMLLAGFMGMKEREAWQRDPSEIRARSKDIAQLLVQFYEATGREERTVEWRKKVSGAD
jgi:Flp pilus assembly protein TadD